LQAAMVELRQSRDGILLPVLAQPGARFNGVTGVHDGLLKVSVTQAPEKGKANKALLRVLAEALDLRRSQVQLVSGELSSRKTFRITGATLDQLQIAIDAAVAK
jgi:uncharacterized protein